MPKVEAQQNLKVEHLLGLITFVRSPSTCLFVRRYVTRISNCYFISSPRLAYMLITQSRRW